jgi:hypothetical protein
LRLTDWRIQSVRGDPLEVPLKAQLCEELVAGTDEGAPREWERKAPPALELVARLSPTTAMGRKQRRNREARSVWVPSVDEYALHAIPPRGARRGQSILCIKHDRSTASQHPDRLGDLATDGRARDALQVPDF